MKAFVSKITTNKLAQSIVVLSSGTILSQAITIAVAPILTRLFDPSDFGNFALFLAIVSTFSTIFCSKFDVAIVVGRSPAHSKQLVMLSVFSAVFFIFFSFIFLFIFKNHLTVFFDLKLLEDYLFLIPITIFNLSIVKALNYYSNSLKKYGLISKTKIFMAFSTGILSISFGFFGLNGGLFFGYFLSSCIVLGWLIFLYRQVLMQNWLWNKRKKLVFQRYKNFPIYNAPTSLLDGLTLALPVFFLSSYFDSSVVGYYALVMRITLGPVSFLSGSISQVNLKSMTEQLNEGKNLTPRLLKLIMILVIVIVPFLAVLWFVAPLLFGLVFGDDWAIAGEYLRILVPAIGVKFVASAVSTTLGATGHLKLGAFWRIVAFGVSLSAYYFFGSNIEVVEMLWLICIVDLCLYSLYLTFSWYAATNPLRY